MKNIWKITGLIFFMLVNLMHACPLCLGFSKKDKRPFFEQYKITTNQQPKAKSQKSTKKNDKYNQKEKT